MRKLSVRVYASFKVFFATLTFSEYVIPRFPNDKFTFMTAIVGAFMIYWALSGVIEFIKGDIE